MELVKETDTAKECLLKEVVALLDIVVCPSLMLIELTELIA